MKYSSYSIEKKMYVQDFCLGKIKCFDRVEPRITGEEGEKPKDENQGAYRVENDAPDALYSIVAIGDH